MLVLLPIVFAYLIGSIPFGVIVTRVVGAADIRKVGSGNIGATNVWRVAGFKAAIWVFIGDIGKGVLAVIFARYIAVNYELVFFPNEVLYVICAVTAVVGHLFPAYIRFQGGKGVNTALGAMVVLLPFETLISFIIFILVLSVFRYVSLGSIVATVSLFLIILAEKYIMHIDIAMVYFYLTFFLAILIILTHRQNIARLIAGTENRFSFSTRTQRGSKHV